MLKLIFYSIGISLAYDGSENDLFNHKLHEDEERRTTISEIIKTKSDDPYDEAIELREMIEVHTDEISYDLANNDNLDDTVSIAEERIIVVTRSIKEVFLKMRRILKKIQ